MVIDSFCKLEKMIQVSGEKYFLKDAIDSNERMVHIAYSIVSISGLTRCGPLCRRKALICDAVAVE